MATQNRTVDSEYVLIASDTESFFISIPSIKGAIVEVATSDTETEPTVNGHELSGREKNTLSRDNLSGFVYARSKSGLPTNIILDVWTPTP